MKQYNNIQRMINIINRAITDYGYECNESDTLIDLYAGACECIEDNTCYDYIAECELSNNHQHLSWSDDMGFEYEADGEFINGSSRTKDHRWARKQDDGSLTEIDWTEADPNNDYIICGSNFDSEGQLVLLASKF